MITFRFTKPWLHALSGLFLNFSAALFAAAFITPVFATKPYWPIVLTGYLMNGMLCLIASVKADELLGI